MQHPDEDLDMSNLAPMFQESVQVHVGNENEVDFDLEASLSRIANLSESLTALSRKRPSRIGGESTSGANSCCSSRKIRRDNSFSANSVASSGGHSFEIDALVNHLEYLEFDMLSGVAAGTGAGTGAAAAGGGGADNMSMSNASITSWNDAAESQRLTTGLWSLQDVEPWACQMCTFENEPVFLACEMCGQTRRMRAVGHSATITPAESVARSASSSVAEPTPTAATTGNPVHAWQEQRLQELQTLSSKPPAVVTTTSAAAPTPTTTTATSRAPSRTKSPPMMHVTTSRFSNVSITAQEATNTGPFINSSIASLSISDPTVFVKPKGLDKNLMGDESNATTTTVDCMGMSSSQWGMSSQMGMSFSQSISQFDYHPRVRMRVHRENDLDNDEISV